jgi:hypothetical protein
MYINFINDRKSLSYSVLRDTACKIKVFIIIDSVYEFVLPSKVKGKAKRVIVVICLGVALYFSNIQPSEAIGLSVLLTPLVRVQPSYQHPYELKIMKVIPRKTDRISYKSNKEILFLMYLTDPRLSSNQQVLGLIKDLRGGSLGLIGTAAFLVVIILIFSVSGGFVPHPVDPGWGLNRPNPFQPPTTEHKYPLDYDLFLTRRTCYADRPSGSQIMARVNPQSSREELTQLSTNVVRTQTQMSGFVKMGK